MMLLPSSLVLCVLLVLLYCCWRSVRKIYLLCSWIFVAEIVVIVWPLIKAE